jgi:VWFA-related protein
MSRPQRRSARAVIPAVLALVTGLVAAPPRLADEPPPREPAIEPIKVDLTEQTERKLLLLDVEAVDDQGRPLLGLTKDDFSIRVNYLPRKIYSVDNLCLCDEAAPSPVDPPVDPAEAARMAVIRTPPHFILYFDYSQLGIAGRAQAVAQAKRWANEVMRPEDRVMVAAYATEAGLYRLSDFTSDPEAVVRAIDAGAQMPEMNDPFPTQLGGRAAMCVTGTLTCSHTGRQEYFHARRSMETLRNFLTDLDEVAERKTFVLFHENATMFPGRIYGITPSYIPQSIQDEIRGYDSVYIERVSEMRGARGWVPDLIELEEELGGAATASRTAVYPILCGSTRPWSVNLSANLADQTGGDYNRRLADLQATLDEAGRRCPCIYRIGLEMSGKDKSYVLRTKVKVRGKPLPSRYRVEYLTDGDRWMRKAQLVMANPRAWNDIGVQATVIPVRASRKTWDVSIQVAVDISNLRRSFDGEHDGEWEVAALLGNDEFQKTWEMLGVFRARPGDKTRASGVVLHERSIKGLKAGHYQLRAFARDREANRFGGSRFEIDLPNPEKGGLSGPVMLQPESWHYVSSLPMKKDRLSPSATETPRELGRLPFGDRAAVLPGQPVHFLAWNCADEASSVQSVVRLEGGESWTFEPREIGRSGPCVQVSSIVDSERLPVGHYAYELSSGTEFSRAVTFEITADLP